MLFFTIKLNNKAFMKVKVWPCSNNTEFISPFPVLRTAASLPATPETALRASTVPANSMDLFRRRAALRASYNRLPFY